MIEACLALGLICLIFLGIFQVSLLLAARDVMAHAAWRGARARTVGFNRWMVHKVTRVAAIPTAGRLVEPPFENFAPALRDALARERPGRLWDRVLGGDIWPLFLQAHLERVRIPEYLAAGNHQRAEYQLDYEDWDTVHARDNAGGTTPILTMTVNQQVPLWVPGARTFYAGDTIPVEGTASIENHYPLYLDDMGW